MKEFLAILARIGGENAPTLAELTSARDGIARELHRLRGEGVTDLEALTKVREAYNAAALAVTETEKALQAASAELDAALADVPNPDAVAEDTDEEDEPVTASVLSVTEAVKRLGLVVNEPAPTETVETPNLATTRTMVHLGSDIVENPSWMDVAQGFAKASGNLRAGKERVLSLRTQFAAERSLTGKIATDTNLVETYLSPEAITAAGGCCSLPEPIRDNPVEGSTARPIRDSLNTLGASAGQFTFYPAVCDVDGVGLWTCADDAAVDPDDPTTWKDCAFSDCDEPQTVTVEGIYTCRTIGNFKQRFAPEQWRAELERLAIQQARVAEVALFTKMRAAVTTTHQLNATGSAYVTLLQGVSLAAAAIRQDTRLGDAQLLLWLPEWLRNAIRADLLARRVAGVETLSATDAQIAAALANEGVTPVWSQDIDPIEAGSPGQIDGPLTDYPAVAHGVLAPESYFSFLDGGQLDLGTEIRDFELNRQNALAAFSESFEGLLARGCNAKGLDVPVEVCDNAPCPV